MEKRFVIVASTKDPASMNILENLRGLVSFEKTDLKFMGREIEYSDEIKSYLVIIDGDLIYADYLDDIPLDADRLIFLSKHASESKMPSLLVHYPGNWTTDNKMGGKPVEFSIADPAIHKALTIALVEKKRRGEIPDRYVVGNEVTHHGPTINRACTFVEIGSTIDEWREKQVGGIVAECVVEAIQNVEKYGGMPVWIGFGGPHYAPKFHSYMLGNPILLGHIAPKYVLESIGLEAISRAIDRCLMRPVGALMDWKGMRSDQRKKVIGILEKLNMSYMRI